MQVPKGGAWKGKAELTASHKCVRMDRHGYPPHRPTISRAWSDQIYPDTASPSESLASSTSRIIRPIQGKAVLVQTDAGFLIHCGCSLGNEPWSARLCLCEFVGPIICAEEEVAFLAVVIEKELSPFGQSSLAQQWLAVLAGSRANQQPLAYLAC